MDRPSADRITDHRARPATLVYLPAERPVIHADRRRCTWMYETRNETAQIDSPTGPDAPVMRCESQSWACREVQGDQTRSLNYKLVRNGIGRKADTAPQADPTRNA